MSLSQRGFLENLDKMVLVNHHPNYSLSHHPVFFSKVLGNSGGDCKHKYLKNDSNY